MVGCCSARSSGSLHQRRIWLMQGSIGTVGPSASLADTCNLSWKAERPKGSLPTSRHVAPPIALYISLEVLPHGVFGDSTVPHVTSVGGLLICSPCLFINYAAGGLLCWMVLCLPCPLLKLLPVSCSRLRLSCMNPWLPLVPASFGEAGCLLHLWRLCVPHRLFFILVFSSWS